jgi:hypothetical protein
MGVNVIVKSNDEEMSPPKFRLFCALAYALKLWMPAGRTPFKLIGVDSGGGKRSCQTHKRNCPDRIKPEGAMT